MPKYRKPADMNSQGQRMYLAVWRKALLTGEVIITLKDERAAYRTRFELYNAIKPIRDKIVDDPELFQACQDCGIYVEGSTLIVRNKTMSDTFTRIAQALGGSSAKEILEQEAVEQALRSQIMLEELLPELQPEVEEARLNHVCLRKTPYYKRGN
jgi:hypothetical protein